MEYKLEIERYTGDKMYNEYANENIHLPFFCECFSLNKNIYKYIDELYKPIRFECYNLAKESKWYNHKICMETGLLHEEYFKKTLGLLLYNAKYKEELTEHLINIIKVGWNYAWSYVDIRTNINMDEFVKAFSKKVKGFDNLSDDDVNCMMFMVMFLALIQPTKKLDNCDMIQMFQKNLIDRINLYDNKDGNRFDYKGKATNSERKCVKELLNKIKKLGITNNLCSKIKDERFDNYEYYSSIICDVEDIMLTSLVENKFNQIEMEEIIYLYLVHYVDYNNLDRNNIDISGLNIDELAIHCINVIRLRYSLRAYRQVKIHYFENNKETMFAEVEEKDKEIRSIKKDKLLLQDDNNKLSNKIEELERENKRLQLELNKADSNKNELIGLREFVFRLDNENVEYNSEIDLDKINSIKGVIIGGHINWVNKLSDKVKWTYISVDNSGFDVKGLLNKDIIVINTQYLNHGMYYKVMSGIEGKDIRIEYINSTNIDNTVRDIWDMIKDV